MAVAVVLLVVADPALRLTQPLGLDGAAQAAAALVKVLAVLVAHLAARLAAAVLAALLEAGVQVGAHDALVELGAADVLHAVERVLVGVVFDEAEAARRLGEAVQPHDQPFDLAALGEELVDLLLGRVEREVADVQRRGVLERVGDLGLAAAAVGLVFAVAAVTAVAVAVAAALVLREREGGAPGGGGLVSDCWDGKVLGWESDGVVGTFAP